MFKLNPGKKCKWLGAGILLGSYGILSTICFSLDSMKDLL